MVKTMIIISDYTLVLKEDFGVFVESSENSHLCPVCQGMLRYRDSRPRIRKKEGGMKEHLMIRRFRCQNCHSYHNELPDCLVPYKHCEAEVIAGVLDEVSIMNKEKLTREPASVSAGSVTKQNHP